MSEKDNVVDVIVLGVGTCGEDLSLRLLGEGLKVVGVEGALGWGRVCFLGLFAVKVHAAGSKYAARGAADKW